MGFDNVDGWGFNADRRGVRLMQKVEGKEERLARAQAKRDARKARRAGVTAILLYPWPVDGIHLETPHGAYAQGGPAFPGGRYQVVVVGPLKGAVADYVGALSAWKRTPFRIISANTLMAPLQPEHQAAHEAGGFLSLILEPGK